MGVGEYIGIFSFGIMSTELVARQPEILPQLFLGAFVIAFLLSKFGNWLDCSLNTKPWGFIIMTTLGGIFASIGLAMMLMAEGMVGLFNGVLWVGMAVLIIKPNLDRAW